MANSSDSPWGYGLKAETEAKKTEPMTHVDGSLVGRLVVAGRACANCCFNLGQDFSPAPDARDREVMLAAAKAWSDVLNEFNATVRVNTEKSK